MPNLESIRRQLGIPTQAAFARLLGIRSVRHYRHIAAGGATSDSVRRLIQAYLDGYRPADWAQGGAKTGSVSV
jgi:hypothetical protein